MAVQLITGKIIKKVDNKHPNYKPSEIKKQKVNGNIKESNDEDVYGEKKHYYTPEPNGNLKMEQMMSKMMGKIDNISGTKSQTGTDAVEVDIQREIAISMVDKNAVKSEVIKGLVRTKKDKLKALRRKKRK